MELIKNISLHFKSKLPAAFLVHMFMFDQCYQRESVVSFVFGQGHLFFDYEFAILRLPSTGPVHAPLLRVNGLSGWAFLCNFLIPPIQRS
jgi:hypothetical protein